MSGGQRADVRGANKAEKEFHRKWLERQKQKAAKQKQEQRNAQDAVVSRNGAGADRRQAESEAIARQEAAAERAEQNRKAREKATAEYMARAEQRSRNLDLSALKVEAQAASAWRNGIRGALYQQQTTTLIGELDAMIAGQNAQPASEPEMTTVYGEGSPELGDSNFDPTLFNKKPRPWW
jgi:hypothetical protein